MDSTLGLFQGLLGPLTHDRSAYADGTAGYIPPIPGSRAFFKVYTGLDHGDFTDAGGDQPDARLFDIHGQFIGMVADPGEYVRPGSSEIFWAESSKGQPVYTLFSANENAQCIAFASVVWPGQSGHFGWVGDWGSECAGGDPSMATWFFSKIAVPGTMYWPNCLWIDMDGGAPATGFQVNWTDMKPLVNDTRMGQEAKSMCQSPSFHIYQNYDPDRIIYHDKDHDRQQQWQPSVLKRSEPAPGRKRSRAPRSTAEAKLAFEQKFRDKLVVDDVPSHNAHVLCESANSAGPSFVNPEHGYFCDMQTKTIHPVCKEQNGKSVCFDMEQKDLVGPGLQKRSIPFEVSDWRLLRKN